MLTRFSNRRIQLPVDPAAPSERYSSVERSRQLVTPKQTQIDGIEKMLVCGVKLQQEQDFPAASTIYQAALEQARALNVSEQALFSKKRGDKPSSPASRTPLEWSILVGDVDSTLILAGSPNEAFKAACDANAARMLPALLERGADINYRIGPKGQTYLHHVAAGGDLAGIAWAMQHGANASLVDDECSTVATLALKNKTPATGAVLDSLLAANIDLSQVDATNQSTFLWAVRKASPDVVRRLLEDVDENREPIYRVTAHDREQILGWVVETPLFSDSPTASPRWMPRLAGVLAVLARAKLFPADVCRACSPHTPMISFAAGLGEMDLLHALIDVGASLNAPNDYGQTPLIHAAMNGQKAAFKVLSDAGADHGRRDTWQQDADYHYRRNCA